MTTEKNKIMQQDGKYNVLYVDDEQDNLLVFKSSFRRLYNVFIATSAAEGLEILQNTPIAVIITDQRMPQITGVEFLKSLPDKPDNMRMILSGYSDINDIIDAINKGRIFRYITKPWDFETLKVTLEQAIAELEDRLGLQNKLHALDVENLQLRSRLSELTNAANI